MNLEEIVFHIIGYAGNARSNCFEALKSAKAGNFKEADAMMENAKKELLEVHAIQTGMIQKEAAGEKQEVSLLLMHAEDHLMNAILAKDLITEMIDMHREKYEQNRNTKRESA